MLAWFGRDCTQGVGMMSSVGGGGVRRGRGGERGGEGTMEQPSLVRESPAMAGDRRAGSGAPRSAQPRSANRPSGGRARGAHVRDLLALEEIPDPLEGGRERLERELEGRLFVSSVAAGA